MGLQKGAKVGLLAKNCANWIMANIACMMGRYVNVPLFTTMPDNTVTHIIQHSDMEVLFLGEADNLEAVKGILPH